MDKQRGRRIWRLEELEALAIMRQSVIASPGRCFGKRSCPAKFVPHLQGHVIVRLFHDGLWVYEGKPRA